MKRQTYREYFEDQLKKGIVVEKEAQKHIIKYKKDKYNKVYTLHTERNDGEYDFEIIEPLTKNKISYEVKADKRSQTSSIFFIEYNNGFGKPSGIEITRADYYIMTDEIKYSLIATNTLKD